jgi:16S rRNA (cytosine1402-N4)-methyltransferase
MFAAVMGDAICRYLNELGRRRSDRAYWTKPDQADAAEFGILWFRRGNGERGRRGGAVLFESHGEIQVIGLQGRGPLTSHDSSKSRARARGHAPVLLRDMLAALAVRDDGVYLDATFGAGGYTRAILQAGAARVAAIDRDPAAAARGRELAATCPNFTMLEGPFGDMVDLLGAHRVRQLDGVVLDLGVSSMQLDDAARGFSFALDGPLDMRMSGAGITAAEVVNRADLRTLTDILSRYGEEPVARRIAKAIVRRRQQRPLERTHELAELVAGVVGGRSGRVDPATRTFQALRIHVNDELGELERALPAAEALLAPGGRLVVVAFHSLEDRIVKRFLAERSDAAPRPSRHQPMVATSVLPRWRLPAKRALRPGPAEIAANPRARSARLRWAERVAASERVS